MVDEIGQIDQDQVQDQVQEESIVNDIDDMDLSVYIINKLAEDIRDRESYGWNAMRVYEEYSYAGYKSRVNDPWKNASNYCVGLTPTLVDTAHANTIGSIKADTNKIVSVRGIGKEDVRTSKLAESVMNWVVLNYIDDSLDTLDKAIHVAYKAGNAPIKCIYGSGIYGQRNKVIWKRIPVENLVLPMSASGVQVRNTDHIFELIPLDENDWEIRKSLRDSEGEKYYKGIENLSKGNGVYVSGINEIMQARDVVSRTSLTERFSRNMRYLMECYVTYPHKNKESGDVELVELIVWCSPNGGQIFRKVENKDIDEISGDPIRPYAWKFQPYPREDRPYGDSLCWLIKQSQEELDYAHNQVSNAVEKLVKTPTFYDPSGGFDPELVQMTPNGWYPVPNPRQNIFIPSYDYGSIFQHYRSFDLYWEYAQRRTGLTELFQGRAPERQTTLGEAELRTNKSDIRFKVIYDRMQEGFKELMNLTWHNMKKLPKEIIVKVLGTSDYKSLQELFPKGMKFNYDYMFANEPLTEKAKKRQDSILYFERAMSTRIVLESSVNQWKLLDKLSKDFNIENVIPKPKEANILSPQESIERIMSGQYDIVPDSQIDTQDYLIQMQSFIKTDTFQNASSEEKNAIVLLLRRVQNIDIGQKKAVEGVMALEQEMKAESLSRNIIPTNKRVPQEVI